MELFRLQENASAAAREFGAGEALRSGLLPGFGLDFAELFAP